MSKITIRNTAESKDKDIELECLICGGKEFHEIMEEYDGGEKEVYCISCGWYAKFRNNYGVTLKDYQVKVEYEWD